MLSQIDSFQIDSNYSSEFFAFQVDIHSLTYGVQIRHKIPHLSSTKVLLTCISYSSITKTQAYRQQFVSDS